MTLELDLIKFLHIIAAVAFLGGSFGLIVLLGRARASGSAGEARTLLVGARAVQRSIVAPAGGLVGIIGLILAWRYSDKGIFAFSKQGWIHISIVLWLIAAALDGIVGRNARQALEAAEGDGPAGDVRARLGGLSIYGLAAATALLGVIIVYLMVFQPLIAD